jgi:predicted dehydrogenase
LDIGIYCVQFASFVFGGEKPTKILSGGHLNKYGVDESTSTTLTFSGGRTATLITHTRTTMPNEAYAVGTKGTIRVIS